MFELLGLDKVKYLGRKLDKKMFYDNGDLSKEDKKIFIDYIDRIEMSYILNSSTLNISSFINDEYYYEAIAYLKVKLKQQDKIDKISKIINNSIPNPLVIIYEFDKEYCISTAIKRLSKTEKNKTVVEESNITDWLNINNLSENDKKFIDSISLRKIPYTNLFDFYNGMGGSREYSRLSTTVHGEERHVHTIYAFLEIPCAKTQRTEAYRFHSRSFPWHPLELCDCLLL